MNLTKMNAKAASYLLSLLILLSFAPLSHAASTIRFGGANDNPPFQVTVSSNWKLLSPKTRINTPEVPEMFKVYSGTHVDAIVVLNVFSGLNDSFSSKAWTNIESDANQHNCPVQNIRLPKLKGGVVTTLKPSATPKGITTSLITGLLYGQGNFITVIGQFQRPAKESDALKIAHVLQSIRIGATKPVLLVLKPISTKPITVKPIPKIGKIAKGKTVKKAKLVAKKGKAKLLKTHKVVKGKKALAKHKLPKKLHGKAGAKHAKGKLAKGRKHGAKRRAHLTIKKPTRYI